MLDGFDSMASRWHDLGLLLLDEDLCGQIEIENRGDVKKCCIEMFRHWLQRDFNATWKTVLSALKQPCFSSDTGLSNLAVMLEKKYTGEFI